MSKKANGDGLTWFNSQESADEGYQALGIKFALPTRPTVRQQLAFQSGQFQELDSSGYMQNWAGALSVMTGWECEKLPKPEAVDVDTATDPDITRIITWVAAKAAIHFSRLEIIPKNS